MSYVIHGANGAQGGPLFARLLAAAKPAVAALRNPTALPGTPAIAADLASVEALTAAYRGADGVFVHLPQAPEALRVQYARNIVAAIGAAKPQRVIASTSGVIIDQPGSPLQAAEDSAVMVLMNGIRDSGVSHAILAPRLYLENLLLPPVFDAATRQGKLRYPVRADLPVSWCSHLDIAEAADRLLSDHGIGGIVGVGQLPGIQGQDLAAGFAAQFGREVSFEALTPNAFGTLIEPLFGPAAANVVGFYKALWQASANVIDERSSAQTLLGLTPRTVQRWLAETIG